MAFKYSLPRGGGLLGHGLARLVHVENKNDDIKDISHVSFCYKVGGDHARPEEEPVVVPGPRRPETGSRGSAAGDPGVGGRGQDKVKPKTTVLGETLVAGDTLPRTGAAATNTLVLAGGLGLAFGLMMLVLARRKTAIHSS